MPAPELATLTSDDLVTGEAVALDLPPASVGLRIVSGLVDVVVTVVVLVVAVLLLAVATSSSDGALVHLALVSTLVVALLVLPTTVETLTRGRSLGKWMTGLRTVRDDGGPITAQHAFVRALVSIVEVYAFSGAPAFFSALVSARGKRLGDHAAGTYVVRDRVRLRLPEPTPMPPALAGWAAAADIAPLPTGLGLAARQYLARLPQVDEGPGAEVGRRLAAQVAAYVAPPPPAGTPPTAFLAAVMAARRERDAARLARESELRRRLTERRR